MSDLNDVKLIGKLGADPEIRKTTDSGRFVVLSLATNKQYKKAKGETAKDTQWHTINVNNWLGDIASTYKKGDKVFIAGELRSQRWQDDTGQLRYSVVVQAKACELITKSQKDEKALPAGNEVDEHSAFEAAVKEACKMALQNCRSAK